MSNPLNPTSNSNTIANRHSYKRTDPSAVVSRETLAAALELRKRGKSYQQISDMLGWANAGTARTAVEHALQLMIQEPAQAVLDLELQRLDALQDGVWDQALAGDVKAAMIVLKVMERRAKYVGLDRGTTTVSLTAQLGPPPAPNSAELPDYLAQLVATLHASGALDLTLPDTAIEATALDVTDR